MFPLQIVIFSMKRFEANIDKEYEAEYFGLKVYVTIKPNSDELDIYEPYVFLTNKKPRLGLKMS
ncbi:hypothetical protein [Saccharolobus islandicus]|uniref:hypothetical protein n=1 Tax=Saccharolobus islandicus TaxID=43080 RepID=UPI00064E7EE1|nr:hypothetical protein [Sulfolobus islandicus]